jgi:hypothetical protein
LSTSTWERLCSKLASPPISLPESVLQWMLLATHRVSLDGSYLAHNTRSSPSLKIPTSIPSSCLVQTSQLCFPPHPGSSRKHRRWGEKIITSVPTLCPLPVGTAPVNGEFGDPEVRRMSCALSPHQETAKVRLSLATSDEEDRVIPCLSEHVIPQNAPMESSRRSSRRFSKISTFSSLYSTP